MAIKNLLIKYCPQCKKEAAVVKNGNRRGRQCYLCKNCIGIKKRQFVDKKYPIEIQSLAVQFHKYNYNFCLIARIFGIALNTARKWVKENEVYKIPDKSQIIVLESYKKVMEKLTVLNTKKEQLGKALKNWQYEKRITELLKELVKPNCFERKRKKINEEISLLYDEKKKLGEIKYKSYSVGKIRKSISDTDEQIKNQDEIKNKIETKCVYARRNYDISEIIKLIEKLTA